MDLGEELFSCGDLCCQLGEEAIVVRWWFLLKWMKGDDESARREEEARGSLDVSGSLYRMRTG
jgi:hypothetical protein